MKGDLKSTNSLGARIFSGKLGLYGIYILIAVIILVLPPFVSPYIRSMIVKILIYSIFALSLNLIFGYTGLLSLGHAAYYGTGAYVAAILMQQVGIDNFWLLLIAGIVAATICAIVFGVIALRVSGIYFLLVTLAIGELLHSVAIRWRTVTGGSDGIVGITYPHLGLPLITLNSFSFYYLVFIIFIACYFILDLIVKSLFGRALQGIQGDEQRMKSLGYNTWLYKYIAFIIGGLFAGVAGVLSIYQAAIVGPQSLGVLMSASILLMVILGSPNVFWGPVVGAVLVVLLEHFSSIYVPARWPLILGAVFVLSVVLLQGGVSIRMVKLWKRVQERYGSS